MRVDKLGRETDVIAHYCPQLPLIVFHRRARAELHTDATLRKECLPERIILIHTQHAGNTDRRLTLAVASLTLFSGSLTGIAEDALILIRIDILTRHMVLAIIVENTLTTVATIKFIATRKGITCHIALVLTTLAVQLLRLIASTLVDQSLQANRMARWLCRVTYRFRSHFHRLQCTAIGTHQLRSVGAGYLMTCQQFESTHHCIVAHRTTLNNHVLTQIIITMKLQNLIQTVLHHRIRQAGRDVCHSGTLAHHLLHLTVHEHSTTRTKVTRCGSRTSYLGKILHLVSQSLSKSLKERTAT